MNYRSGLRRVVIGLSVLYAGVFILMLLVHPGTDQFYTDFHNTYQILPPLFAAISGITYALTAGGKAACSRAGWLLIGLGAFSFGFGQSTWTWYETVLRLPELPSPGLADVGYIGAYPLLIIGVVLLFPRMSFASRARLIIDSALVASSVAVLSWYFLVAKLWDNQDVSLLGKLISVAYPLGDVAALLCAIMLLKSSAADHRLRRSMGLLAIGIVLLAFADSAYTYYTLHDAYHTGSWFDWGWSFGWLLIGHAALPPHWLQQPAPAATIPRRRGMPFIPTSVRLVAPYCAVLGSLAIVIISDIDSEGRLHLNALVLGAVLVLLVILRQVLTLLENQHLTAKLRTLNSDLEELVGRRTEQLTGLLHLTKSVNSTLLADQVIAAAVESTQHAFQGDGVVLRIMEDEVNPTAGLPHVIRHTGLEDHTQLVNAIEQLPICAHVQMLPLPLACQAQHSDSTGTYLRAPLLWQQRVIGMIGVVRWNATFGLTEQEMLESIGVEVGTALENARRYAVAVKAADGDSVTGLYNHRAIHQRLDEAFEHAHQHSQPLTVIMMDLNNFKRFNDTYGHPVGDQVLKCVAKVLRSECRSSDILGRYGGDEFVVILPNTDAATALDVAERLRTSMTKEGFRRTGDQRTIPVTLSFGLATFPVDSTNRHELLAIADANLYIAKQSQEGIRSTSDNQRTNRKLRAESTFEVLDAMVMAVDNKDRYTRHHSEDVTEYSLWLGEELELSQETMRTIRIGCLLHDLGKIGVPDDILRKPGRLTAEEYEVMKRHPRLGALIVGALPGMESILDIVRSHHERWDGAGYPDGLKGEAIPFLGRLVAVSDAFSAMTTDRPYRKGMTWEEAFEEIRRNSGTQFDPVIAQAFMTAMRKRIPVHVLDRSVKNSINAPAADVQIERSSGTGRASASTTKPLVHS